MIKKKKYFYKSKRLSKGEYIIATWLEQNNIRFIHEQSLSCCLSDKGNPLRVDFFLPDMNIVIEMQGEHHFKPINKYRKAQKVHEQTVLHDARKKKYLLSKNISILEIDYKDRNNNLIESILEQYLIKH